LLANVFIMSATKLWKVNTTKDGTERFQTQLELGRDTVSFIRGTDGVMKVWRYGENGASFYPTDKTYEIVDKIEDMKYQPL